MSTNETAPQVGKDLAEQARPLFFADVIGQPASIETLTRLLKAGQLPHTIALMGPPGTGKTTTARLTAASLNCSNRDSDGEPCGECESCQLIARNAHPDVQEIDCVMEGGVDDMRQLIEMAPLRAAMGGVRVQIFEEFQEASAQARTSLAKHLEEPPANTVCILTTTKPESIPAPILSRCLQLRYGPVPDAEIREQLGYIAEELGIVIEPDALSDLAQMANGGVRTAIQSIGRFVGFEGTVTRDLVRKTAPTISSDSTLDMVKAIAERKPVEALEALGAIPRQLRSFDYVLLPLLEQLHAAYLLASLPDAAAFLTCTSNVQAQLKPLAIEAGAAQISAWLDIVNATANKPARLMSDDAHLQMMLVQLCHTGSASTAQPGAGAPAPVTVQAAPMVLPEHVEKQAAAKAEAAAGFAAEFSSINWSEAVAAVEGSTNATLKRGWAAVKPIKLDGKILTLEAPNRGSAKAARPAIERLLIDTAAGALDQVIWS